MELTTSRLGAPNSTRELRDRTVSVTKTEHAEEPQGVEV